MELPPAKKAALSFEYVSDLDEWRVAETTLHAPGQALGGNRTSGAVVVGLGIARHSLKKFAALRGFKGMTVPQLRRLHGELQMGGNAGGHSEISLVEILLKEVLGEAFSADKLAKALLSRHGSSLDNTYDPDSLFEHELDDQIDDLFDDDEDIAQQWRDLKKAEYQKQARRKTLLAAVDKLRPPSGSASGSGELASRPADPANPKARERTFMPLSTDGQYQPKDIKPYLPHGSRMS